MRIFNWDIRVGHKREIPGTVAFWLNGDEARDILCPEGYTSLKDNDVVCRCAHKVADLVSNMTVYLMENGEKGDRRIKNELSRLIDIAPNEVMTRKTFIYKLVDDLVRNDGNSVWLPVMDGRFIIASLAISLF
jgi:phage portal protein BeeE